MRELVVILLSLVGIATAAHDARPDYSHVDTIEKATALAEEGGLFRILLFPPELGGEDVPENAVYVPGGIPEAKDQITQTLVRLLDEGLVDHLEVEPEYGGRSVVPTSIRLRASSAAKPGEFSATIEIWKTAPRPAAVAGTPPGRGVARASAAWTDDPGLLVREFIGDYRLWNDGAFAMAMAQGDSTERVMLAAERDWQEILHKYCPVGFVGQPIAFGSESEHDLAREQIVTTEVREGSATVRTRTRSAVSDLVADYEYVLRQEGGRWFLEQVYFVDAEGKHPGL